MTLSAPDASDLAVRQAERADLLAIVRIERTSFTQPWPYEAFEGFLGEPGFLVAVDPEGAVVGYVVADVTPSHTHDVGHVKDVAVHPEYRGAGIGTALLTHAMASLRSQGADTVKLEVRESNAVARGLYRRLGFDDLRRMPGYYDDGEDAIVMVREL